MMDELKPEGIPVQADTFSTKGIMAAAPSAEQSAAFVQAALGHQEEAPQEEAPVAPEQPAVDPVIKDAKERNFKAMRLEIERSQREAEYAQRERDEALRRLSQYEPRQAKPVQPDPELEPLDIKDDELLEGKHLKKTQAQTQARIRKLEKQLEEYQQQTSTNNAETRINSQYPDFGKVVTNENMQILASAFPELARSIDANTNVYDKAVSAYTMIKKFGIYEEQPLAAEKERIIANTAKPKPLASIAPQQGDSPLSRANAFAGGLTEELKLQLRKEMAEAIRKY